MLYTFRTEAKRRQEKTDVDELAWAERFNIIIMCLLVPKGQTLMITPLSNKCNKPM